VVLEADEQAVTDYGEARDAVDTEQAAIADALATSGAELVAAEQAVAAAQLEHEFASRELAVFLNGGSFVIHGFVFPVAANYSYGDSFGAHRMVGTPFEHWHEGTDILAPTGTELVASERGVITSMGTGILGGITVWLKGESGTSYYYAHLTGYAPGSTPGWWSMPARCSGTWARRVTPPADRLTSTSRSTPAAARRSTRTRSSGSPRTNPSWPDPLAVTR
jgi:hypothetical protein